jgi:dTDP-4-dehydrorhamnose 3,5-epimerase
LTGPAPPRITGVIVEPLKVLPNQRGRLMEVQRCDDANFPGFGQAYVTSTYAGVVKAWYRHHRQVDQLAPIAGLVRLVLYDDRPDSASWGALDEIVLGELAPKLVQIPPGVWHGFQAIGTGEAFLLHMNSQPFATDAPDEDRLAPDDTAIPFRW